MEINKINSLTNTLKGISTQNDTENSSMNFMDTLKNQIDSVNDKQVEANETTNDFIEGNIFSVDEVMMKTEEAKMSIELAVQIRNKLVEAYQELTKMQL